MKLSALLAVAIAVSSCAGLGIQPPIQGDVPFLIPGTNITAKTHYWAYGTYKNPKATPLVLLHGGPGIPSQYFSAFTELSQYFPIYIYDQIGIGASSHFPETIGDTTFWTEDLFVAELKNLLKVLKLENNFSLLGHSWGGMLAPRFINDVQPKGLKKLILASAPASIPLWVESVNYLRHNLPADIQAALDEGDATGDYESPEYQAAVGYFYDQHLCRIVPNPPDISAGFAGIAEDPTVYITMNGPNEFTILGSLQNWTGIPYAKSIKVPTLLTNGKYDEAQDLVMQPWYDLIDDVQWVKFENSSHMAFWEEHAKYMKVAKKFLLS